MATDIQFAWSNIIDPFRMPTETGGTRFVIPNSDGVTSTVINGSGFTYGPGGVPTGGTITSIELILNADSTVFQRITDVVVTMADIGAFVFQINALRNQIGWFGVIDQSAANSPQVFTDTSIVYANTDGTFTVIQGTGFAVAGAQLSGNVSDVLHIDTDGVTPLGDSIFGLSGVTLAEGGSAMFDEVAHIQSYLLIGTGDNTFERLNTGVTVGDTNYWVDYVDNTGNDTIGGTVPDTHASYALAPEAINANLVTQTVVTGTETDTFTTTHLMGVTGTDFDDTITGDGTDNILDGGPGNDTIDGGNGNDLISAGGGDDSMTGGSGTDTVSYQWALNAVTVSLGLQGATQNTGGDGADFLSGFENLIGSSFADRLTGSTVVNVIEGGDGNDTISGIGGNDTIQGGNGNDILHGNYGRDNLAGGNGLDRLYGDSGNDRLYGGSGGDRLVGGDGNDTLAGNGGNDKFYFATALDETLNVDTITDYSNIVGNNDSIRLNHTVFSAFSAGHTLTDAEFISGAGVTAATTADQHIIYDTATGWLYYDQDGSGSTSAAIHFATVNQAGGGHPVLAAGDFIVY